MLQVVRSGVVAQGPVVAEFEQRSPSCRRRHAVAVNNGTTALVAAIQALDLQPGDEVITTPFTFIATLNAILEAGATVRFGDIRPDDFALDPASVRAQITDRTRVIMPVHLYGQSADMAPLVELARECDLAIVEDAAQAHGATYRGTAVGNFGIGCFSFYATKNLTTGEGGIITTNDDAIAEQLRILRNQGMRARYEYVMAGHNYRMTDLQAALVLPAARRATASSSRSAGRTPQGSANGCPAIEGLVLPQQLDGRRARVAPVHGHPPERRRPAGLRGVGALAADGVGSGMYYPKPVYDYDTYRDRPDVIRSETPVADDIAARCVSLPVHQHLKDGDLDTIADAVRRALR